MQTRKMHEDKLALKYELKELHCSKMGGINWFKVSVSVNVQYDEMGILYL